MEPLMKEDQEAIKSTIKQYLEKETKRPLPSTSINLISGGFLDSFMIIKLITFIESHFQIVMDVDSISEESFSSIDKICEQIIAWKKKQ